MEIAAELRGCARAVTETMCKELLANPIIEQYHVQVVGEGGRGMKFGVVIFPGSNCDADCHDAIAAVTGQEVRYVWHEETDISDIDCIVLPGGFSYGDYLRCGAVARFSPVMNAVIKHAASGNMSSAFATAFRCSPRPVCFPGRSTGMTISIHLQTAIAARRAYRSAVHPFLYQHGQVVEFPIAHGEGRYLRRSGDAGAAGRAWADRFPLLHARTER